MPPATQRNRNDAVDAAMHDEKRSKSFLGDPVDRDVRDDAAGCRAR